METMQKAVERGAGGDLVPELVRRELGRKWPGRSVRRRGVGGRREPGGNGGPRLLDWLQLGCSEGRPGVVDSVATPGTILRGKAEVRLGVKPGAPATRPGQALGVTPLRALRALCLTRFGYRTAPLHFAECLPGSASGPRLIYVVDDLAALTELYALVLEGAGYLVRTFNDRPGALAALEAERHRPQLLITDYRGDAMPVERFLRDCTAIHPLLRILMVSGLDRTERCFAGLRLAGFLHKPFTPEELRQSVRAALDRW